MLKNRSFVRCWSFCFLLAAGGLLASPDITALGPFGGDVRSLAVDPSHPERVVLGTADGQLFVSEDFGERWQRLEPGLDRRDAVVDNLAFDPRNPEILYAATWELKNDKGRLYRSPDGGKTWDQLALGVYDSAIRALAVSPSDPDVLAIGISEGVVVSSDGGGTWDRISRGYRSLYNVSSLAFDPEDSNTLYAGTFHLGWRTSDLGKSWEPIHTGMIVDSHLFSLLVNPDAPNVLYASACTGVYKSSDRGQHWTRLRNGLPGEAKRTRTLHMDPLDSATVYAGTTVGLFVSRDAGNSWKRLLQDVVVNSIVVHPHDQNRLLVGTDDAGVLKSSDRGASFSQSNSGFINRHVRTLAVSPRQADVYYASVASDGHYGGFFLSTDGGRQWTSYNEGLKNVATGIHAILPESGSETVYLGTESGIFRGSPGDGSWKQMESTSKLFVYSLDFVSAQESSLYVGTSSGLYLLQTSDGTPRKIEIPVYKGKVSSVFYDRLNDTAYIGTDMGIFRSENRGQSWDIKVNGLPYTGIHVVRKIGSRLFAGTRTGLFYSDNRGESWTAAAGIYPIDIVSIETTAGRTGQLFASDSLVGYLFTSDDNGTSWRALNLGLKVSRIGSLLLSGDGGLLAGTLSDGVYRIEIPGTPPASVQAGGSK